MKNKKNNIVYFAHPIYMYDTEQEIICIDLIHKNIKVNNIINPSNYKKQVNKIQKQYCNNENMLNSELFFKLINKCNIFCYYIKDKVTPGIKKELNYALDNNKKIYMINDNFKIIEMNKKNINVLIKNYYIKANNNWVLSSIDDYSKFFDNNPEIRNFILSQFDVYKNKNNELLRQGIIPHYNSVYITDDFKKIVYDTCTQHQLEHSFVDPNYKEKIVTCPFTNIGTTKPAYSKFNVDNIDQVNIDKLLLSARTLHKNMFIFDSDVFTRGKGIILRDKDDKPIYNSKGKTTTDKTKILGAEIVFDLDIATAAKNKNITFFTKKMFDEYLRVISITQEFIEDFWDIECKLCFSGNGIYFSLPPFLFEDYDYTFESFSDYFKDKRWELEKILNKNKIRHIVLENKYGWNRYFKAMGTFHLKHERLAIPLNVDEVLDYKWLNEITDISTGLEGNVINEIIKRSGW